MSLLSRMFLFACVLFSNSIDATPRAAKSFIATDLRCEYLTNPKGIDQSKPRLSWIIETAGKLTHGVMQKSYQLIVSSSLKNLNINAGDIWDSKWVISPRTHHITYSGTSLISDRTYYWKVRVKDQSGAISDWSEPATFTTGFLSAGQWLGKWIGDQQRFVDNGKDCNIWDPWFRKKIVLTEKPGRAFIYVASVGYHELYINGKKIGNDVLAPATSDHTKRARYIAYDITDYLLKGDNLVALWLGASWSIFAPYFLDPDKPTTPIVNAQAFFYKEKDPGGTAQPFYKLITDNTWKTATSPNKLLGIWALVKWAVNYGMTEKRVGAGTSFRKRRMGGSRPQCTGPTCHYPPR